MSERSGTMLDATEHTPSYGAFIDGQWDDRPDLPHFDVCNPATGGVIASVASGDGLMVDAAVAGAKRAFETDWRRRSPRDRAQLMHLVAVRIRDNAEELAELTTRENGKPKRDALIVDINGAQFLFDFFGELATTALHGHIIDQDTIEAHVVYEPYGVVAGILPFNWPPAHFAGKCAPAIAAGNTVVLKPSEQAPLAVLRMVELANEVLPPGVLSAVPGLEAGGLLAGHRDVSRVSFTGSTATGRAVMRSVADNLAVPSMELGGKNAAIVFEDADPDVALRTTLEGMFFNKGEACTSTARILVHESIYEHFLERFATATKELVVGDGLDPDTDIGPLVDARQKERVLAYIELAEQEGARLVAQGAVPIDERLAGGHWVAPTVFADVVPTMRVAQEEIFGPVACVMKFATEDEAVNWANATDFGLTAAVCTSDLARATRVAGRLECGMVFINNYDRSTLVGSPFGGVKGSGSDREHAAETLMSFVRSKNIRLPRRQPVRVWPSAERAVRRASR